MMTSLKCMSNQVDPGNNHLSGYLFFVSVGGVIFRKSFVALYTRDNLSFKPLKAIAELLDWIEKEKVKVETEE